MSSLADETRWMDATAQAALVADGEVKPVDLVEAAAERIEQGDGRLNAVVLHWFDQARDAAADPDLPAGPFRGVPFLLKDLGAHAAGFPITNGNRALKDAGFRSSYDTELVRRHRAAGLVIAGRTASSEFGALPAVETAAWGATRNPWDPSRIPGGSSGGAAAAVAAGFVPAAHASDGGGSIRIPASCCGLVGLKPTQGRITMAPDRDESNLGVEHVVCRTVRDSAALLDATRGPGVGDTVQAPPPSHPYAQDVGADPGRLRIGLLDHGPVGQEVEPAVVDAVHAAAKMLEGLGHTVEPAYPEALADETAGQRFGAMWATNMAVAMRALGDLLGRTVERDDVEPHNWAQAEFAGHLAAADYAAAVRAAAMHRRRIHQWWAEGWDLLLTPTLAERPLPIGEMASDPNDPLAPLRRSGAFVPFTPPFNVSGQPAISLPLVWSDDGLPIGIQLVAAYAREDVLIRVASQLEAAHPWADRRPPS